MGIEPTSAGATIRCVNHFATIAIIMAGVAGIEPTLTVLETAVLPLNYTPKMEESGFEPLNPKERIYSPSRLASSLLLQLGRTLSLDPTSLSYKKTFLIASGNFNFFYKNRNSLKKTLATLIVKIML